MDGEVTDTHTITGIHNQHSSMGMEVAAAAVANKEEAVEIDNSRYSPSAHDRRMTALVEAEPPAFIRHRYRILSSSASK